MFGILNINKPAGITSRDAVDFVSRLQRKLRVGHCGTLDPLATGVLLVCVGPATRLIQFGQSAPKTYVGNFRLGLSSDTEDITGHVRPHSTPEISRHQLSAALENFVGEICQRPPAYSALKVDGKRAYELAREGQVVELEVRQVQIHSIELLEFQYPDFQIRVCCGSGTYIRSLGRDIAASLKGSAVMTGLERTAIGDFQSIAGIDPSAISHENVQELMMPPESILGDMARTQITDSEFESLANGGWLQRDLPAATMHLAAFDPQGRLSAVLRRRDEQSFTPKINFVKHLQQMTK